MIYTPTSIAGPSSSPIHAALVPSSSSPARAVTMPLVPAKIVASSSRRGVNFSPQPDTRYFDSAECILPEKSLPPPSIRSYADTPSSSPAPTSSPSFRSTPLFCVDSPRSILKQRMQEIRIAKSVEEGTLNNREAARLLVTGRRPGLVARDSFQIAMLRKGADEVALKTGSIRKGTDDLPGSDDSAASDDLPGQPGNVQEENASGSDEEEEEVEQDGALATGSLVNIILNGAEDLLTLEEAYKTLTLRLKHRIPFGDDEEDDLMDVTSDDISIAMRPLRDEAPAMVRALQRDVQRLLGKVPLSEDSSPDRSSSPFRSLMPLHDSTPINQKTSYLPSPPLTTSGSDGIKSPNKPTRQGYSESEVRYRREASGVGQAAMGFLALALHTRHIFSCFTDADIQALLDLILVIPRTPHLPTPNPKRTYFTAVCVLSNMKVPAACVNPIKDKIARAIETMTSDTFGSGGSVSKDANFKKEVYSAIVNLVSTYPSLFFPFTAELLAPCLRSLCSQAAVVRNRAAAAVLAFASAKSEIQKAARERVEVEKNTAAKAEWIRLRTAVNKSEIFVTNFLRRTRALPGKPGSTYGPNGEKRTEWTAIERLIKDKLASDVYWTCGLWAALVSLIGSQYSTSGLSSSMDYLMDRSLQISANTTRPLLARIAWSHAIHAYISSGSSQSFNDRYSFVRSYKPFGHGQDAAARVKTVSLPVEIGINAAKDDSDSAQRQCASNSRFDDGPRCFWERKEKAKRVQVMSTCGEGAAAVIYAFVGVALLHEDQSAKEVTAMTGLPSSDGAPVPESALMDARMERLDKTWDQVVKPILGSTFAVFGIDRLKLHGWSLFEALVKHTADSSSKWDLDRLLCERYLSGEALMEKLKDKEVATSFLTDLEKEAISPKDVPSMGSAWVVRRLDDVLSLFQDALQGITGLNDLYSGESVNLGQGVVFPVVLSKVWSSILHALATCRTDSPTEFASGVRLVTRHLCQVFNGSPSNYLPISLMGENDHWTVDLDTARIHIFTRLFDMAHTILGPEAISAPILSAQEGDSVDLAMSKMAFGADSAGQYSMVGSLLALLMGTKVFSAGLADGPRASLKSLVSRMLDIGCTSGVQGRLLGDMTNRLHAVFEEQEHIQLDMWRVLAIKWSSIVEVGQPASNTSGATNHTGALLVNLLSNPFRGRQLHSVWHHQAAEDDLIIWNNLLQVVVARFKAKRVGSNLGVLETLAGHLGDFLRDAEKASTISLSCLASAASYISCAELSHHVDDHYSINENYVPTDFLNLVSDALNDAYPRTDTLEHLPREDAVSPAVYTLLDVLKGKFDSLPVDFVLQAFEAMRPGLLVWMSDDNKVVMSQHARSLYVSVLHMFERAVEQGLLPRTAGSFDSLLDIVAPRLSRAASRAVPEAFQSLWSEFEGIESSQFSDETRAFLQSVIAAVPDLITVKGLSTSSAMSEEESFAKYPHAREVESQSQPAATALPALVPPTPDVNMAPIEPLVDVSTEYDADMSASVEATLDQPTADVRPERVHQAPTSSPTPTETSMVEESVSDVEAEQSADVFGPASAPVTAPKQARRKVKSRKAAKGGRKKSRSSRSRSSTADVDPETSLTPVPPVAIEGVIKGGSPQTMPVPQVTAADEEFEEDPMPVPSQRGEKSGLFSATRWMSVLPGIGGLFSPNRSAFPTTSAQHHTNQSQSPPEVAGAGSSSRKRKTPTFGRSYSEPQLVTASAGRTPRSSAKRPRVSEVIYIDDSDDEDPLLLSPESARQRQMEQLRAREDLEREVKPVIPDLTAHTQSSSGRYDDAPEPTQLARRSASAGPSDPSASPVRTASHARLLHMFRTAHSQLSLLESMNYDDVLEIADMARSISSKGDRVLRDKNSAARRGAKQ